MTDKNLLDLMMKPTPTILYGVDHQLRSFFIFVGISFVCHLCLFGVIAFAQLFDFSNRRIAETPAITVDLVAFNPEIPSPPPAAGEKKPAAPVTPPEIKTRQEPAPAEKEPPPVKQAYAKKVDSDPFVVKPPDRSRVKQSLKKKSMNTEKLLESAVKRIEKQSETAHPKAVEDRIHQLRKEVESQAGAGFTKTKTDTDGPGGLHAKGFSQIEVYQAEVSVRLKNNWVFSEELAGNTKGLETRLVIKILPDGSITDVWYEKRSGNIYLDDSAYKTVMKSNPLPPLPEGFLYYHLVLGFTPTGLHQ